MAVYAKKKKKILLILFFYISLCVSFLLSTFLIISYPVRSCHFLSDRNWMTPTPVILPFSPSSLSFFLFHIICHIFFFLSLSSSYVALALRRWSVGRLVGWSVGRSSEASSGWRRKRRRLRGVDSAKQGRWIAVPEALAEFINV